MDELQIESSMDLKTIHEASGFKSMLKNQQFLTYLEFFSVVMPQVDILFKILQKKNNNAISVKSALDVFQNFIAKIRNEVDIIASKFENTSPLNVRTNKKQNLSRVLKEACDVMSVHINERFLNFDFLICSNILNSEMFVTYTSTFPTVYFDKIVGLYPFLNKQRLHTELQALYRQHQLFEKKTLNGILQTIFENHLTDIFVETVKLGEIIIATPMSSSESEREFSCLKRIKTFLRSTMSEDRLNALAVLSIEKVFIDNIDNFDELVITKFAEKKERRLNFFYKTVS